MTLEAWEAFLQPGAPDPLEVVAQMLARPSWQTRAACRGSGPSNYVTDRGTSTDAARATCARCEVRTDCLAFALADPSLEGVWGGTSDRERRQLRRDANDPRPKPGIARGAG